MNIGKSSPLPGGNILEGDDSVKGESGFMNASGEANCSDSVFCIAVVVDEDAVDTARELDRIYSGPSISIESDAA